VRLDDEPDEEEVQRALDDLYGQMKGVRLNTTRRARRKPLKHERKGKKGRRSPVTDYVRSLGAYQTTAEVAEELGMSDAWVRKAAAKRWTQAPSFVAPFGDTHVNLYTKEDVEALRKLIAERYKVYPRDQYPKEG
jgi:hypothetical protein